jgi:hypothetical protein
MKIYTSGDNAMTRFLLALFILLALTACKGEKQEKRKAKQVTEGANQFQKNIEMRNVAKEKFAESYANKAVKMFQIKHGRNPTDLDELMEFANPKFKKLPPGIDYFYDPATGKVTVENEDE